MEKKTLSRETFNQFREMIYERCGIFYQESKTSILENRMSRRLEARNLSNFEEYLYFLRYDPRREDEFTELYNSITTNETSFFRDISQLEAFRTGILPKILEKKSAHHNSLRIWSAACSTGEEPYSLAMILADEGLAAKGWKIDILASDISSQVLRSAARASYGGYAVRNTPDKYLRKYFTNSNDVFMVKPDIKQIVNFENINLVNDRQMRNIRGMDVIFCRNVLIYFDDRAKKKVISSFYDTLSENGFLVVGFSESLFNITRAFKPIGINKCIVYQKI